MRVEWEGLCAPGGLRDDAYSGYSARRASLGRIRARRVRQYAKIDRSAPLLMDRGGLATSGESGGESRND
jgi:hypothetical protein